MTDEPAKSETSRKTVAEEMNLSRKPDRGGRPSRLTPSVHKAFVSALASGHYLESASALCGVDPSTARRWLTRGSREIERRQSGRDADHADDRYVRFAEDARQADADAEDGALRQLRRAGRSDWRAAAWFLEHRHPAKWGPRLNDRHIAREFEQFLDQLEQGLDEATYQKVLSIVANEHDEEEPPM